MSYSCAQLKTHYQLIRKIEKKIKTDFKKASLVTNKTEARHILHRAWKLRRELQEQVKELKEKTFSPPHVFFKALMKPEVLSKIKEIARTNANDSRKSLYDVDVYQEIEFFFRNLAKTAKERNSRLSDQEYATFLKKLQAYKNRIRISDIKKRLSPEKTGGMILVRVPDPDNPNETRLEIVG